MQHYFIPKISFVLLTMGLVGAIASQGQAVDVEAGKQLYQTRCAPCHGPDGKAQTPTAKALKPAPRDHTDGAYMNALSNEHLTKVIKEGGTAVGKSPIMPPQTDLNEQQIQDIVAFLRTLAVPPYQEK